MFNYILIKLVCVCSFKSLRCHAMVCLLHAPFSTLKTFSHEVTVDFILGVCGIKLEVYYVPLTSTESKQLDLAFSTLFRCVLEFVTKCANKSPQHTWKPYLLLLIARAKLKSSEMHSCWISYFRPIGRTIKVQVPIIIIVWTTIVPNGPWAWFWFICRVILDDVYTDVKTQ